MIRTELPLVNEKFETMLKKKGICSDKRKDAWDRDEYLYSHVQSMYEGFISGWLDCQNHFIEKLNLDTMDKGK